MVYKRVIATIILIVGTAALICISFIYIHWTAYQIAAHHIDYAEVEPPVIMSLAALAVFAISVKKQNKHFLYKYLAIIEASGMMVGTLLAL